MGNNRPVSNIETAWITKQAYARIAAEACKSALSIDVYNLNEWKTKIVGNAVSVGYEVLETCGDRKRVRFNTGFKYGSKAGFEDWLYADDYFTGDPWKKKGKWFS